MSTKSFNEMTYEEKVAQTDAFFNGLKGEDWDRFLIDTEYEQYKNIICPFLDEDFAPVHIYNTGTSIVRIAMPFICDSQMNYEFTYDYNVVLQMKEHAADNYGYKLAA